MGSDVVWGKSLTLLCLLWRELQPSPNCFLYKVDLRIKSNQICESILKMGKVKVKSLSRVRLFVTPWTVAYQGPPSMGFSRREYWSGLPFPSPGDLPNPGIEPGSPTLQADTNLWATRDELRFEVRGLYSRYNLSTYTNGSYLCLSFLNLKIVRVLIFFTGFLRRSKQNNTIKAHFIT